MTEDSDIAKVADLPIGVMYLAGKEYVPRYADTVSRANNWLSATMESFNEQSALAGDPQLMKMLLEIGEAAYIQLHKTALSMEAAAHAIVATADDFVRTDEEARRDLDVVKQRLGAAGTKIISSNISPISLTPDMRPGELTDDGSPSLSPGTTPGASGTVPSTPEPPDPRIDRDERDRTERRDRDGAVVPPQPADES